MAEFTSFPIPHVPVDDLIAQINSSVVITTDAAATASAAANTAQDMVEALTPTGILDCGLVTDPLDDFGLFILNYGNLTADPGVF